MLIYFPSTITTESQYECATNTYLETSKTNKLIINECINEAEKFRKHVHLCDNYVSLNVFADIDDWVVLHFAT